MHARTLKHVSTFLYLRVFLCKYDQQAADYWMRFEWQHRGSSHVHSVAWLPNAPDVEQLLRFTVRQEIIRYANRMQFQPCQRGVDMA